jgi:mobilome CxxCx(11)CxxC protein
MEKTTIEDQLRNDCWTNALHSFGYSYAYTNRASKLSKLLKLNNFLGIIVPLLFGGIILNLELSENSLKILKILAGSLGVIQLFLSALALGYKWDDSYSYYLESINSNSTISSDFVELGKYPNNVLSKFKNEIEKINIKHKIRSDSDSKYSLSEKEKRKAMRYSLRKFKRDCAGCHEIPKDMISTDCPVCGQF